MQETIQQDRTRSGANVVIKPPRLFLISIVASLLLQLLWPLNFAGNTALILLGFSLISGSLGLMVWADGTFKRWDTAVNPDQPTTKIITTGPYRFSRNPMYLAFLLIQAGVGFAISSWWLFVVLLPAYLVLRWGVIAREEQYLRDSFDEEYTNYKTAVRRWL